MSFIDDIKACFSADEIPKEPIFRAVMFGDNALYLENVCSIVEYSCEQIILCLKKGGLRILGKNLYIKKYCVGDVAVCGKISAIERF